MMDVDLISLLPHTPVRRVIEYCLNDLGLTLEQTEYVLYDGQKVVGAMNTLLSGGISGLTPAGPESPAEEKRSV